MNYIDRLAAWWLYRRGYMRSTDFYHITGYLP
jgi:hypothetical protein